MPLAKKRTRNCQHCGIAYELGKQSTLHKYCSTSCRSAWHYVRWKSNGGLRDKTKVRAYWLKHQYGISLEEFNALLEKQEYRCAICATVDPMGYGWHVDHNHNTGKVRGILCQQCNQAIGMFQEDIYTMQKAIAYLENS